MVQSPIGILLRETAMVDNLKPLEYHGHWESDGTAMIENTGTSAKMTFDGRKQQPYICGGPLATNERFIFEQMHFHWAERDDCGSEHVINGQRYSMEVHLVHFNAKYGNIKEAVNQKDGLAVIAFFIQSFGNEQWPHFYKLCDSVKKIRNAGSKCFIDPDCLLWMASQELNKHYYTYHGSLTTAPFSECVTWIIYQAPVYVSEQQVAVFRDLNSFEDNEQIRKNCRSIQTPPSNNTPTIIFTRQVQVDTKLNASE